LGGAAEQEQTRGFGAATGGRKRLKTSPDSRHIPVEIACEVWERDGGQCTFVDEHGRRCSARRFLTFEHLHPYALGGPTTAANLCLRCQAHNALAARKVFGEAYIEARRAEREVVEPKRPDVHAKAHAALRGMGFPESKVRPVLAELAQRQPELEIEALLRAALGILVPSNVALSEAAP
jgi:5-methylcytosine-specific restriction endonuclease McrA